MRQRDAEHTLQARTPFVRKATPRLSGTSRGLPDPIAHVFLFCLIHPHYIVFFKKYNFKIWKTTQRSRAFQPGIPSYHRSCGWADCAAAAAWAFFSAWAFCAALYFSFSSLEAAGEMASLGQTLVQILHPLHLS